MEVRNDKWYLDFLLSSNGWGYSEDLLQQVLVMWFRNNWKDYDMLLFSVPNGGKRDGREMNFLKSTGLTPGVSDLILSVNPTIYIELKKFKGGIQSPNQKKFQRQMESVGNEYYIENTLYGSMKIIREKMAGL